MRWTHEATEWVRRCAESGLSAGEASTKSLAEIGHHYTRRAIIGKLWRMGIRSPAPRGQPRQLAPAPPLTDAGPNQEPRGCRYVLGTVGAPEGWRYCQGSQKPGSSYCPEHHEICHISAVDGTSLAGVNSAPKGRAYGRSGTVG